MKLKEIKALVLSLTWGTGSPNKIHARESGQLTGVEESQPTCYSNYWPHRDRETLTCNLKDTVSHPPWKQFQNATLSLSRGRYVGRGAARPLFSSEGTEANLANQVHDLLRWLNFLHEGLGRHWQQRGRLPCRLRAMH